MTRYVYISHSSLSHHGILGMKWGKRNGPPYPLDPSDHSAAEKKANNGRYSQGVTQNRSKKSSSGKKSSGRRKMSDEERAEKIRKIKKGIAIGTGVAAAAALTAGGIYAAKHPETTKAALKGLKNAAINTVGGIRDRRNINKMHDDALMGNSKALARDILNRSKQARKQEFKDSMKAAKTTDKWNAVKKKVERRERRNDRKGILTGNVLSEKNLDKMQNDARFITNNEQKIREKLKSQGKNRDEVNSFVNDLYKGAKLTEANRNYGERKKDEYKSDRGVRGVINKAWKPVATVAGIAGTVGGVAGSINGAINNTAALANNKNVKKLYKDLTYDPYEEEYREEQKKKKKN